MTDLYDYVNNTEGDHYIVTPGVTNNYNYVPFFMIIFTIIILIAVVFVLIFLFWTPTKQINITKVVYTPKPVPTKGASKTGLYQENNGLVFADKLSCELNYNRYWDNICNCAVPFFSPDCSLETYKDTYTAIGNDTSLVTADYSQDVIVDRLSFSYSAPNVPVVSQTKCTDICDNAEECYGVIWTPANNANMGINSLPSEKPVCNLILSPLMVIPNNNLPYDGNVQSTIYLKNDVYDNGYRNDPQFKDRVFLIKGTPPIRYWLNDSNVNGSIVKTLYNRELVNISWLPTTIVNNTGCTNIQYCKGYGPIKWFGIFSNRSYDINNNLLLINVVNLSNKSTNVVTYINQQYIVIGPDIDYNPSIIPTYWTTLWIGYVDPIEIDPNFATNTGLLVQDVVDNGLIGNTNNTTLPIINDAMIPITTEYNSNIIGNGNVIGNSNGNSSCGCASDNLNNYKLYSSNNYGETVNVIWNLNEFPTDKSGNVITINVNDTLNLTSSDGLYHDIISTDANWNFVGYPYNIAAKKNISANLQFRIGTHYIIDRINPLRMRLQIIVLK